MTNSKKKPRHDPEQDPLFDPQALLIVRKDDHGYLFVVGRSLMKPFWVLLGGSSLATAPSWVPGFLKLFH